MQEKELAIKRENIIKNINSVFYIFGISMFMLMIPTYKDITLDIVNILNILFVVFFIIEKEITDRIIVNFLYGTNISLEKNNTLDNLLNRLIFFPTVMLVLFICICIAKKYTFYAGTSLVYVVILLVVTILLFKRKRKSIYKKIKEIY